MRVVKACWKLLEATSQITDQEQITQRVVKIVDAFLYMQGEIIQNNDC